MMMIRILSVIGIMAVGAFLGYIVALFFVAAGMTIEQQKKQNSTEQNSTDNTEQNKGELP